MKKMVLVLLACALVVGCAPSSYLVSEPQPSNMAYQVPEQSQQSNFKVVDMRSGGDRTFHSGILNATLNIGSQPIDPVAFLAKHAQSEMLARGLPVSFSTSAGDTVIDVSTFRVRNHRSSGFSPFVTFTMLSADVALNGEKHRITSYIKRGKVPVWSFDEVIQPTFNEPLSLAVKEFSAKLNQLIYKSSYSDSQVEQLAGKLQGTLGYSSYLDVYQLAFSNNPKAIPVLAGLVDSDEEYVRLAAISGLGVLGAVDQMPLLTRIYQSGDSWSERGMALKAIADLNTPESQEFIKTELLRWEAKGSDKEARWNVEIIGLYL